MIYRVDEIQRLARIALDMNERSESLVSQNDPATLTVDEIILSKIEQAARVVESNAPVWLLDSGKPLSGSITFAKQIGIGRGRMQLPDDFMRLITFKMSDWERAVTQPILESDPDYLLQSSRFSGLRGNPQKPVVAIISEPTGLVLEFWSCNGGASVVLQRGRYLPIPRIRNEGIEICEKLKEAVIIQTAYLSALTLDANEAAQVLLSQCKDLMK